VEGPTASWPVNTGSVTFAISVHWGFALSLVSSSVRSITSGFEQFEATICPRRFRETPNLNNLLKASCVVVVGLLARFLDDIIKPKQTQSFRLKLTLILCLHGFVLVNRGLSRFDTRAEARSH